MKEGIDNAPKGNPKEEEGKRRRGRGKEIR